MPEKILDKIPPPRPEWREFMCGWGAAFVNITLTYPINKVMFRQMLHGLHTDEAIKQLRTEGFRYLYRGIIPPLCQKSISVSIMFGMYDHYQKLLSHYAPSVDVSTRKHISAVLAGSTEALLTPFERIQMLLQDRHFHNRFRNTFHAFEELRHYGFREYYRGFMPIALRNGLSNAMFFEFREVLSNRLPKSDHWSGKLFFDFVTGAVVGAFISTVFYPINILKTHMQCTVGGPFHNLFEVSRQVYEERGRSIRRMFYGVHMNYTRALLSWGIINTSYELFHRVLFQQPQVKKD